MIVVSIIVLVAVWAVWVEIESRKDPDYKQEAKVEVDPSWPFPTSKKP